VTIIGESTVVLPKESPLNLEIQSQSQQQKPPKITKRIHSPSPIKSEGFRLISSPSKLAKMSSPKSKPAKVFASPQNLAKSRSQKNFLL
jgi:hypothetical protein